MKRVVALLLYDTEHTKLYYKRSGMDVNYHVTNLRNRSETFHQGKNVRCFGKWEYKSASERSIRLYVPSLWPCPSFVVEIVELRSN